jgi:hypothetical protein
MPSALGFARRTVLAAIVAASALSLLPAVGAAAPAAPPAAAATARATVSPELPSWLSDAVVNLARKYATKAYAKKFAKATATYLAKRAIRKWLASSAQRCPEVLPGKYFCSPPPQPRWGRGMALQIAGRWPPEVDASGVARRYLRPGYIFWLTCWSSGGRVDNGFATSNLWYRLTNGLWVNDAWLDTGTNYPLPGVAHC